MAKVNTHNPAVWFDLVTAVRTSSEGPLYALGQYREEDGKGYRYVQYDNGTGNLTCVDGKLAYQVDSDEWIVTMDVSDTDRNLVVGVFSSVIADSGYGWIQVFGNDTVTTDGGDDIAKGDAIVASAAGDGTCDSTAQDTAPTNRVVGWATADDNNGNDTVAVFLTLR